MLQFTVDGKTQINATRWTKSGNMLVVTLAEIPTSEPAKQAWSTFELSDVTNGVTTPILSGTWTYQQWNFTGTGIASIQQNDFVFTQVTQ